MRNSGQKCRPGFVRKDESGAVRIRQGHGRKLLAALDPIDIRVRLPDAFRKARKDKPAESRSRRSLRPSIVRGVYLSSFS